MILKTHPNKEEIKSEHDDYILLMASCFSYNAELFLKSLFEQKNLNQNTKYHFNNALTGLKKLNNYFLTIFQNDLDGLKESHIENCFVFSDILELIIKAPKDKKEEIMTLLREYTNGNVRIEESSIKQ